MTMPEIVAGAQSAPETQRRHRSNVQPLLVTREYVPDRDRCIRAVMALLAPRPSLTPSAGQNGEIGAAMA